MRTSKGWVNFEPVPEHRSDLAAGNDKTLTVPAGEVWRLLWGYIQYTTSAAAGNRQLKLEITNTDGPLWKTTALSTQNASEVGDYHFDNSGGEPVATKAGQQYLPIPAHCLLKAGDTVRVYDSENIDAVGDVIAAEFVIQQYFT